MTTQYATSFCMITGKEYKHFVTHERRENTFIPLGDKKWNDNIHQRLERIIKQQPWVLSVAVSKEQDGPGPSYYVIYTGDVDTALKERMERHLLRVENRAAEKARNEWESYVKDSTKEQIEMFLRREEAANRPYSSSRF